MIARRLALGCAALLLLAPASAKAAAPTDVTTKQAVAVSCPSETLCVAVATDTQAARSDAIAFDPAAPASATTTPLRSVSGGPCPTGAVCFVPSDASNVSDIDCPTS